MMKNGTRLRSLVCDTQVIIVKASPNLDELHCGGAPMIPVGESPSSEIELDPHLSGGTRVGKRYVDDSGAEVLVTKAGVGTLSIGSTTLIIKDAKPLPASD